MPAALRNLKRMLQFAAVAILMAPATRAGWEEGDPLPDLASFDLAGDLPAIAGSVAYIDFWASWCAPCKASFPAMQGLQRKFGARGFRVVAVGVDTNEAAMRRFLGKMKPIFAVAWDRDQKLAEAAALEAMPTSFLVDAQGTIRFVHRGWQGAASERELEEQIELLLREAAK